MPLRNCAHCGQTFTSCPQVPRQTYCSSSACQRARRQLWLQDRLREDPDYRDNRSRSQRAWLDRNPDYWQSYRAKRSQESPLDAKSTSPAAAPNLPALAPGLYLLRVLAPPRPAKTDAWIVELTLV